MAADVIMTSAAPTISIRIFFSFFADPAATLDGTQQLANHNWFD
ncbi:MULTISPECIES: hypothetical protein [Bradyrhizobium]|nr:MULTISPECIES: hypothetical protein [Bradyrhizobium]MBB4260805.1 lauroyl/myristoyl acyltransferase [Bradyrhizobium sp. CIR3A]MBB4360427.1 lauroyl/myristoyl acyltransferase [Bradyrhizobium sp. CIR18]MBB4393900.1 lauroyl/myristoyl acyltransferase [Bradyrhizobium sp. ERR14]MBB4429052.1 lauroyl/myristoyl acyltransferase [Bradyrhizobium sp. CIR48]NYG45953.1 lauroyl/myristoyl acyltransferase [Bradyrhizobium sp. IAR9]